MPNIIFNIPLYFTGITTCIYTELAPKLTEMASVAQSIESRVRLKPMKAELNLSDTRIYLNPDYFKKSIC